MTKTTLTALGAALIALGQELQGDQPSDPATADPQPTPRRGRGPAKQEPPADPDKDKAPAGAKTEPELRELIKPLVDDGRGAEVVKLIAKHGGTKLSDLPPANHVAFIRDIEGLTI